MDQIDLQISQLLRKKEKIQMLRHIQKQIHELNDSKEHPGIKDELRDFFDSIINKAVLNIQQEARVEPSPKEEVRSEGSASETSNESGTTKKAKASPNLVEFVKKYGPLSFKRVKGKTLSGDDITGTVKQVAYPNVLVEGEHGGLYEVNPETLTKQE